MQCPRCQHENPPQAKFCLECGARFANKCGNCGTELPSGAKFCLECGQGVSTPAPQSRFTSPETYTPKHLAEKILTSKSVLEGERKQVTVLFADLKGSMELLADRDPEEARKLLDPVLERMMEAVHRYEGTVNQVMGDGIMALFGAPVAHEDHAVRACYAALRMQRRVNLYADEIQRGGGTPVQIRVGLNSGEVVVRSIGSDLRMDYTAVGQTTHLAARMEQMAKPGSALVTGETLNLAEGFVQVRPLGAVTVKGLETATQVYELIGIGPARSRLQASATRGLTRFVGRESELQQLAQALERAAAGHGQTVAVVGEAGVGKSRFVWEFARSHRTHGWLVLESGSVSYGRATPYLPVIELLKAYCRIQDRDDQREIRERVAGKLLMLDRALEPLLTPLLALLDVPVDDAAWDALDPPQRRQRTLEAVKRLLLRESQFQPLLLIFEDLHWIDSETQALLDGLIESLPTARVLLLVNYRPEYQHAWGGKTYYLQLRIDPLPPESAEALLNALLGQDRTLEPLKRVLIARTEGNPFFLEESVQTLVETKVLVGERGAYRVAKAPEALQIPATAQAILAARIDRLPPEQKRLLQAASVIGKDVPFALLQATADMPEEGLRRGLTHLQGAEFLYETSLFPDLEYTFKHALTHEVAYGSVLQERRRTLHARIVEAIERLYAGRLAEQVERLAHHAVSGERWHLALEYLEQAAAKAFARSAHPEAVTYLERALGVITKLPESVDTLRRGIDLRLRLRNSLFPLGEMVRLREILEEARRSALALDDRARLGRALGFLAHFGWSTAALDRGTEAGKEALAIAAELADQRLELAASYYLGQIRHAQGNYPGAIHILTQTIDRLQGDLLYDRLGMGAPPSIFTRGWLALSLAEVGAFDEALARAQEALRIGEETDHPYGIYHGFFALGAVHAQRGEVDRAIALLERGLATAALASMPAMAMPSAYYLGRAYGLAGRATDAISLLESNVQRAERMEWKSFHTLGVVHLGNAYLLAGRREEAVRTARRAQDLASECQQRSDEVRALLLLAQIAAADDPPAIEDAEDHFRTAVARAEQLGMRPLAAHCHLGLGKLYHRTGDRSKAREHLTTATTMYREMAMGFWLAQAEAA